MEVLIRVDACFLRGGPGGGVHACRALALAGGGGFHPVDEEGDGVFCGGVTAQTGSDASRGGGCHARGTETLRGHHRVADVDVVAVEVVRDVGVDARPGFEGLELEFRLGHVAVEVVEVA